MVSSSMDSRITSRKDLEREYKRGEQACQRGLDTAVREGDSTAGGPGGAFHNILRHRLCTYKAVTARSEGGHGTYVRLSVVRR